MYKQNVECRMQNLEYVVIVRPSTKPKKSRLLQRRFFLTGIKGMKGIIGKIRCQSTLFSARGARYIERAYLLRHPLAGAWGRLRHTLMGWSRHSMTIDVLQVDPWNRVGIFEIDAPFPSLDPRVPGLEGF